MPEDLSKLDSHSDLFNDAVNIEGVLRQTYFAKDKKGDASDYEVLKEKYYSDSVNEIQAE